MIRYGDRMKIVTVILCVVLALITSSVHLDMAIASSVAPYDSNNPIDLDTSHLQCSAGVLIDGYSGKVLYGKNSKNKVYPASTTKIMTALLALEHGNLSDMVTIGDEAGQIPGDSTRIPVSIGEQIALKDLLFGTMIASGNDGANAIAVHIAGSLPAFIDMMNEKAKELGCENTNFKNAHGYTDNDHYTTPRDMAKIACEAMKNPVFRDIAAATSYTLPPSNKRENPLVLNTKNQFIMREAGGPTNYPYGIGIKTGFTSQAQHTFVGAAEKDGMMFIAAVFKSTKDGKWIDAKRLIDYGFAAYRGVNIGELYSQNPLSVTVSEASLNDGSQLPLSLGTGSTSQPEVLIDTPENIEIFKRDFAAHIQPSYNNNVVAPVHEGDIMGALVVSLPGGDTYTYQLLASKDITSGANGNGYANVAEADGTRPESKSIEEIARRAAQSPLAHIGDWWWTIPIALVLVFGGWSLLSLSQRHKRLDDVRRRRKRYSRNFSRR